MNIDIHIVCGHIVHLADLDFTPFVGFDYGVYQGIGGLPEWQFGDGESPPVHLDYLSADFDPTASHAPVIF